MTARILLVEAERLSGLLAQEDFEVEVVLSKAYAEDFDLIILDDMPAVCAELRRKGIDTSILLLTEERVAGLRLGADDCVSRACDASELLARIEALLRRAPKARRKPVRTLHFGEVDIDFGVFEVRKGGRLLDMTLKEFRLLQYLVDHREKVVSRKEILTEVWEYDATVSSRTVDVHIGWLRQKLEDNPQQPGFIKTVRGRGYRFDWDAHSR